MTQLMWHHALYFLEEYVDLGHKNLGTKLGYDVRHGRFLAKFFSQLFNVDFDKPLNFVADKHDEFCPHCPRRESSIVWEHGSRKIKLEKCDVTGQDIQRAEKYAKERILSLTGKENPTPREIYMASCSEMKRFGVEG